MNSELFAQIFLNRLSYMTPRRFRAIVERAGSAAAAFPLKADGLESLGIASALAQEWMKASGDAKVLKACELEIERSQRGEFAILLESDAGYPELLRELSGRPPVLYIKGRWPLTPSLMLGVVGTRHPSRYGLQVTEDLVSALVTQEVSIASGMAMGIDRAAHQRTLGLEGQTVGVLGHGFGTAYPRENVDLYRKMAEAGTLLTEFAFEVEPSRLTFPRRNRIISGLSRGVVVVEAGVQSGALITARYAAEQGRDVFAVPGSIYEPHAQGCHRLIKEGVQLIQSASDILETYAVGFQQDLPGTVIPQPPKIDLKDLNALECSVLQKVLENSLTVDELATVVEQPIDLLMNALLSLELKGLIRSLSGQRYAYNN